MPLEAATIDGIRAHVGNPTQITLFRMPVSAGSLHEKTVHNEADTCALGPPALVTECDPISGPACCLPTMRAAAGMDPWLP